jgi:hypothetical protein
MSEQIPAVEEGVLRERLRQESLESRPAFSETLHQEIITAVKRRYIENAATPCKLEAVCRMRRSLMSIAAAASLLCAVVMGWWWAGSGTKKAQREADSLAAITGRQSQASNDLAELLAALPANGGLAGRVADSLDSFASSVLPLSKTVGGYALDRFRGSALHALPLDGNLVSHVADRFDGLPVYFLPLNGDLIGRVADRFDGLPIPADLMGRAVDRLDDLAVSEVFRPLATRLKQEVRLFADSFAVYRTAGDEPSNNESQQPTP